MEDVSQIRKQMKDVREKFAEHGDRFSAERILLWLCYGVWCCGLAIVERLDRIAPAPDKPQRGPKPKSASNKKE